MRVLVTDGDNRAALAVTRSLGRAGHEVLVGERRLPALAQSSRFCADGVRLPDAVADSDAFVDELAAVVRDRRVEVLLPVSDITTFLITEHRARFEPHCRVPFASAEIVARAADKVALHDTAVRLGVPVPDSVTVFDPHTVPAVPFEFPVVIKPWKSRVRVDGVWRSSSVSYAHDRASLMRDLASRPAREFPVMIQRRVIGPGVGVFACYRQGAPVAIFAHRRVVERPPWGGVSVISESVAADPVAREMAVRLLNELRWHGVAMVEFKQEAATGVPKLMEINGRFWGSLQLAIDAGVDFPALLLEPDDLPPRPQTPYRLGVRTRWLWGSVDSLALSLFRWGQTPRRPLRERGRVVREFVRFWGPDLHYDNPKWDDRRPFLHETAARFLPLRADARPRAVTTASVAAAIASPAARSTDVQIAVDRDLARIDRAAWNALAAVSATNAIFQTAEWADAWWGAFGSRLQLRLVSARTAGRLVGLLPLVVDTVSGHRMLRVLGDGRADYCDALLDPGRPSTLDAMFDAVVSGEDWDVLRLSNVPASSPTLDAVQAAAARRGLLTLRDQQFLCPTLLVDGHADEVRRLANKPSLRRPENYFARGGQLRVQDLRQQHEILPLLDTFFQQHVERHRLKHGGSLFDDARNRDFYRRLVAALDGTGWLLFSVTAVDDRPLAFHFGFDYNGVVTWYKPSFDVVRGQHSPGLMMVRHLMQYAVDHGRRELDFTIGDEPFKRRFTNAMRQTQRLQVFRQPRTLAAYKMRRRLRSLIARSGSRKR